MKQTLNASLKNFNSFSVEARAGQLIELESRDDLRSFTASFDFDPESDLILGGGSNILFAGDIAGSVVLNRIKGRTILPDSGDTVLLEASAGENWHQLVLWSLDQGLSGIENLSLIPGFAGAAPMQNIGAYGVELADVIDSVQALDLKNGSLVEFKCDDCGFAYRDSRFKSEDAGRYLVTLIRMRLQQTFVANLDYAGINEELHAMGIHEPSAKQVSDAVVRIRRRKLPDPAEIGNAGSFFKNPVVGQSEADTLKTEFKGLPVYPQDNEKAKLSAAWMIEHCGWKGRSMGQAGVSQQHALVLVNRENATGRDVLKLAHAIRDSVQNRFDIELQIEPRIIES